GRGGSPTWRGGSANSRWAAAPNRAAPSRTKRNADPLVTRRCPANYLRADRPPPPATAAIPQSTQNATIRSPSVAFRSGGRTVARMIGRILFALAVLAVGGLVLLALVGVWDRYERETAALGFRGDRAGAEAERAGQRSVAREQAAPGQFFQQAPKLVGAGGEGSVNQGMSVAL